MVISAFLSLINNKSKGKKKIVIGTRFLIYMKTLILTNRREHIYLRTVGFKVTEEKINSKN